MKPFEFLQQKHDEQAQEVSQPIEQEPEVVTNCCKDGVDGVACGSGEIIAAHAMLVLDKADAHHSRSSNEIE
jgi:hypothetical protein